MYQINIWPIITATITAFMIGSVWYSPLLFSKEWIKLIGMTEHDMDQVKAKGMVGMWKLYLSQLIITFVTFLILGFIIFNIGDQSAGDGVTLALLLWIGFALPIGISGILWKKQSIKLLLIEGGVLLINLVVGGAIIGSWN